MKSLKKSIEVLKLLMEVGKVLTPPISDLVVAQNFFNDSISDSN